MVKTGYKQTDIGLIPEDWGCLELPEITNCSSNSIKIGPFGSALKKELLTKNGYKVYGQENIFAKDMTIGDRYVNQEHFNKLKSCEIKTNDFLISMMGTIGKCFIVPKKFEEGIIDSHLIRVRINEAKYNLQLLVHIFGSDLILRQISQLTVGGIMDGLSSKIIKKLHLPIPPKEEQKAIASALSDVDRLIASLEKLIAKKESIKTATMQQLLTGKKRLDGFSGEWEEKRLGDISNISRGASPRPIEDPKWFNENSQVGWVRISDVSKTTKYLHETIQKLSTDGIAKSRFIKNDSLIMSICATLGKPVLTKHDTCIHDGFVVFNNLTIEQEYLYYYLLFIENNWIKSGQSGSQTNLNTELINTTLIKLPPTIEEQQAIAEILSNMDNEIEAIKNKLSKTKAIKDGMMSELLSGKTRLKGVKDE